MATAKKTTGSAKKTSTVIKTAAKSLAPILSKAGDKFRLNPFKLEVLPKKTRYILIGIVCVVLLGIVLFINRGLFIAALVNGEPVSRIAIIGELEKQHGAEVITRLVDRKLILQEARKQNLSATQEEVDSKRKKIIDQVSSGNEKNFQQILEAQGLTSEEFTQELRIQIVVEKMLSENTKVSDEEFNEFVSANPDLLANAENEEETRNQLREQLKQQKLQTQYTTWIEKLRKDADIVKFVSY